MMSCEPSDPTPPISDFDIVLKGGKYQHNFEDPKIVHNHEYQVIFTIEDCDLAFVGSKLGGKICYKMDLNSNDEKVLSGWAIAVPPTVSKEVKTYTWTFKAGASNADNVHIEDDATTPQGGKQYFSFTAQKDDNNYGPNDNFNIKGGFEVIEIETITNWDSAGEITLSGSSDGKGTLIDADMTTIRSLPPNSKITFTVTVTVNNSNAKPGWGVCGVGGWESNNSISINIPATATVGEEITFKADIKISDILALPFTGNININPYNGAKVIKAELFQPKD